MKMHTQACACLTFRVCLQASRSDLQPIHKAYPALSLTLNEILLEMADEQAIRLDYDGVHATMNVHALIKTGDLDCFYKDEPKDPEKGAAEEDNRREGADGDAN